MSQDRAGAMNPGPNNPVSEAEELREERVADRVNPGANNPVSDAEGLRVSGGRAEAMNPGPNNPVSEAEELRQEAVAERVNPGGSGVGADKLEEAAEGITPGRDGDEVPEALDEAEHRMSPGPQE